MGWELGKLGVFSGPLSTQPWSRLQSFLTTSWAFLERAGMSRTQQKLPVENAVILQQNVRAHKYLMRAGSSSHESNNRKLLNRQLDTPPLHRPLVARKKESIRLNVATVQSAQSCKDSTSNAWVFYTRAPRPTAKKKALWHWPGEATRKDATANLFTPNNG
jgi:hypothetical protein